MTDDLATSLGDDLVAVVLAGSLARGQGMVLAEDDGPRVLSDIDLYVVRSRPRPDVENELRGRFVAALADEGVVCAPLDLAFVAPDYFAGLGDALPARQLALGTRVLHESAEHAWARPEVLARADDAVDPDDAHRLLLNRMAETLLLADAPDDRFTAVHRAKRWIDAPLAWVASHGCYRPRREDQLALLEELSRDWTGTPRAWMDRGLAVARAWLEAIVSRELDPDELRNWPGHDDPDAAVRDWTWPIARALFRTAGREGPQRAMEALRTSVERGVDVSTDFPVVEGWLRRRTPVARWRLARRWHPLAPVAVRPWWRYASGGAGHERVYAAAALLHAGHEDWSTPLEDVLIDAEALRRGGAAALGRLWADWILGGGRR